MTGEQPKDYGKALWSLGGLVAIFVFLVVVSIKSGRVGMRHSTTYRATNPDGFNIEIGALMAVAGVLAIMWFLTLLRMLKDRRDRLDAAAAGERQLEER